MAKKVSIRRELKKAGKGLVDEFNRQVFGCKSKKKKQRQSGPRLTIAFYHGEPHTIVQKGEVYKVEKCVKKKPRSY